MAKSLIKKEYPSITKKELEKINRIISTKCSEYYFLDFLRCTNGDVDDAIAFFYLDEKMRSILVQYLMRFEIQVKSDFAKMVEFETRSKQFWKVSKYYLPEARQRRPGKRSHFYLTRKNIQTCIDRMTFRTIGPLNYAAMYSISFGCFKTLFRYIDTNYKQSFIEKYTSHLRVNNFDVLYSYFDCIRMLRNRCAHGNHIVTLKFKNDLNSYRNIVSNQELTPLPGQYLSVFEAILLFLIKQLNCGNEFKRKLKNLFNKYGYQRLLATYPGKHSLSINTLTKIF